MSKSTFEKAGPKLGRVTVDGRNNLRKLVLEIPESSDRLVFWEVEDNIVRLDLQPWQDKVRTITCHEAVSELTVGELVEWMHHQVYKVVSPYRDKGVQPPPGKLGNNGKEFEKLILAAGARLEKQGILKVGHYGTQVSMVKGKWMPIPSFPDFDGVEAGGYQFVLEAKVCSKSQFEVQPKIVKQRQIKHMIEKSKLGVPCGIIMHLNERKMKTDYDPPSTWIIPIHHEKGWEGWRRYAERKKDDKTPYDRLNREEIAEMGIKVDWVIWPRCTKAYPDLRAMLYRLRLKLDLPKGVDPSDDAERYLNLEPSE